MQTKEGGLFQVRGQHKRRHAPTRKVGLRASAEKRRIRGRVHFSSRSEVWRRIIWGYSIEGSIAILYSILRRAGNKRRFISRDVMWSHVYALSTYNLLTTEKKGLSKKKQKQKKQKKKKAFGDAGK